MDILGISGSLRRGSYNTRILECAGGMLPEGAVLGVFGCGGLPLYNADLDGEAKPGPVERLLAAVSASDAILFATPEYNHSIPGVLKNAIDWASRPAYRSVMAGKPAGVLSASVSPVGGARVQAHLRQVLASTLSPVYPAPDFLVGPAEGLFDGGGVLADPDTRIRLERYLAGFCGWVGNRTGGGPGPRP